MNYVDSNFQLNYDDGGANNKKCTRIPMVLMKPSTTMTTLMANDWTTKAK
jgi:hypothetical protein